MHKFLSATALWLSPLAAREIGELALHLSKVMEFSLNEIKSEGKFLYQYNEFLFKKNQKDGFDYTYSQLYVSAHHEMSI